MNLFSLSFTVAFLSPFVLSSSTNNVHEDLDSLSESKKVGTSVQDINQSLSSSLTFPRMLVNTYTPPSLNETNDDILSWTNASHSKEEFVQTSDHDDILSAKYSDLLISCSSKKESGQTSDHSSSSFHTSKSNTENVTLKKNDLSMSSSESVSSLSSCKETSVVLSTVVINYDNSECPSDLCNHMSDSSNMLSIKSRVCGLCGCLAT